MLNFRCRICRGNHSFSILKTVLPLAADVRSNPSDKIPRYPLNVVRCNSCGHIQLAEAVHADLYDNYLFTASYMEEFSAYADTLCKRLDDAVEQPGKEKRILEIGSSNGSLLKLLHNKGWKVLGIEPSAPMVELARLQGVDTIHGYFEHAALEEIKRRIGTPSVVILRHVLEHLECLEDIILSIREILGDGLLAIEVPYVRNSIKENRFYDFFHEHLSYFSVSSLKRLLSMGDFNIHRVYETPEVGGSILVFAGHCAVYSADSNVERYIQDERVSLSEERVTAFVSQIPEQISRLKALVHNSIAKGKTVAGWGAGQRGCTLIAHCGFQSESLCYVIDANENYWWRYVPGTDIQIVPPNYYQEHMVDEILIFATGYAESIMETNPEYEQLGGSFIRISAM